MKKFLLSAFALAVAFSAAAFQMAPVQKTFTPKAFTGKTNFTPKHAPKLMKADSKISSLDDISGAYVMMYYDYFNDYANTYCNVTITKTGTDTYAISGWWGSWANDLVATVDQAEGTVTIQRQEIYRNESGSTFEAADLVNVENLLDEDESNDDDFSAPLVGTIYLDGIVFDCWWGAMITEHSTATSVGKFFVLAAMAYLMEPNGTMTWNNVNASSSEVESTPTTNVLLEQVNDTVYISNFANWGVDVYALLSEDHTFIIPPQLIASDDDGDFYTTDIDTWMLGEPQCENFGNITGTGTDTSLADNTEGYGWTAGATSGYWYGWKTSFVINRIDDDVFIWGDEPVIPDVYILGEVGDNTWAANVGQQMTYDAETQKYTAEIECKDNDNNGYDYFSFSTKLGNDWADIAGDRFGAVSNGDFLVTDEWIGQELSLTKENYQAYKIPAGKYTLTVDYANMKLVIEKVAEPFIKGDVNGDGDVNVVDITALIDVIMNDITDNDRADVNGDGHIDVVDITALIDIIMNM